MDNFYLSAIASEIEPQLAGRRLINVRAAGTQLRLDFGLREQLLIVSLDPGSPAFYLGSHDSQSETFTPFLALLRNELTGASLIACSKDSSDRIIRMSFETYDPAGDRGRCGLVVSLIGRAANVFLTDDQWTIQSSLKESKNHSAGDRIEVAESADDSVDYSRRLNASASKEEILESVFSSRSRFGPQLEREFVARCATRAPRDALRSLLADLFETSPRPAIYSRLPLEEIGSLPLDLKTDLLLSHIELAQASSFHRYEFNSLSEAADRYYDAREVARNFQSDLNSLKHTLSSEIKKQSAAIKAIEGDRTRFEDPDRLKRLGDLILANLSTAKLEGSTVRVIDYYDPAQQELEIKLDEGVGLKQAASRYFARYQKARRGLTAVTARLQEIKSRLEPLSSLMRQIEEDPSKETLAQVRASAEKLLGRKGSRPAERSKQGYSKAGEVGRKFLSTEGYEIIVGRKDRDNDLLTFRVARSHEIWLHAADYPGSHVVIRNPNRTKVSQKAIQEAAELAAFFSQAKRETKAAVHYTEKKFVTKPPRAKPGLVRLSSFKTIFVEPKCSLERVH